MWIRRLRLGYCILLKVERIGLEKSMESVQTMKSMSYLSKLRPWNQLADIRIT